MSLQISWLLVAPGFVANCTSVQVDEIVNRHITPKAHICCNDAELTFNPRLIHPDHPVVMLTVVSSRGTEFPPFITESLAASRIFTT